MLGAIVGDTVGSVYEFDFQNYKGTDFPLFSEGSRWTDDTVMSLAVAEAMLEGFQDEAKTESLLVKFMQKYGRMFPDAGYGGRFRFWLASADPKPYNSFGNGSAMRVSSVAWIYDSLEDVRKFAEISAKVTHNHLEGVKGAVSVACAIFWARHGASPAEICERVEREFGYPLSKMSCDEIRPDYHMDETCQGSVPQAFCAFREGSDFESVLRLAVSLGGDSDTIAAIAGSMAEGAYKISEEIRTETLKRLDKRLLPVFERFEKFIRR